MAWRIINSDGDTWHVQPAAEKCASQDIWTLTLSFRQADSEERRCIWAPYPIESTSKSSVFTQADRISDDALRELLSEHVA
ncbi:MAG: hypothetical protein ACE5FJ_02240 [Gemmatimonadales bacterium]